ncbi:MAG TPA: nicotinate (nicotinamide) nucleotide adenylyltransferase [Candidatus Acidoferrales bacterium]|jgi:nicotinate-nucleotide adenylyltransferase|nr:nicotinate (nicotinamide) nucleotide adenylyltransferase [Candidatus Acidoferrales bacterium]
MQRLGLYGGAFNPVHLGHLLVAQAAVEELGLDKLFLIPASQTPFKQEDRPAPAEMRLQWLRLAFTGQTRCELDDQEIRRGGVSYTIETARHYEKKFPQAKLFYLIGADNVPKLNQWREADELAKLLEFAAVPRPGQAPAEFPKPFRGCMLKGFPFEVSSSDLRARVKAGLPIEFLVPPFVAQAIRDAGAYA